MSVKPAYPAFILLAALCTCCDKAGSGAQQERQTVPVEFAFSTAGGAAATRADVTVIPELLGQGDFQGMEDIRIIPFSRHGAVTAADVPLGPARRLPSIGSSQDDAAHVGENIWHGGLIRNNRAHLFPYAEVYLPTGMASALVYGHAPLKGETSAQKHVYGSITEQGMATMESASDIYFLPDPIFADGVPSAAGSIASILSYIAQGGSYTRTYHYQRNGVWHSGQASASWSDNLDDATLPGYFSRFTAEDRLLAGDGAAVEYMLTELYRRLLQYESSDSTPYMHFDDGGASYPTVLTQGGSDVFTMSVLYNGLRDKLLGCYDSLVASGNIEIDDTPSVSLCSRQLHDYPVSAGLPFGAAMLRWNGVGFEVVKAGMDGIAPLELFCYMPPLCYYVNTVIRTTTDKKISQKYTSDASSWETILGAYRQGTSVTDAVYGVALEDPLQFATGMMMATVRATSQQLRDAGGASVTVSGTKFPVTGILVGGQHRQFFDFSPDASGPEYLLYDNQVSGVYLTSAESSHIMTLALPTPEYQEVYIFLEFRNDSGAAFDAADGPVYPGNRFYLAGLLEKPNPVEEFPSAVMQDHVTIVKASVESLENATTYIPETGQSNLKLGLHTNVNWVQSSSSYITLY